MCKGILSGILFNLKLSFKRDIFRNSKYIGSSYTMGAIKFIYSEKATKFCEISTLLLSYVVPVKCKVEISLIFLHSQNTWTLPVIWVSLKLRHYEKATKLEKNSHQFSQNSCFCSVVSKQVGYYFKFLWPSQKSWTLHNVHNPGY